MKLGLRFVFPALTGVACGPFMPQSADTPTPTYPLTGEVVMLDSVSYLPVMLKITKGYVKVEVSPESAFEELIPDMHFSVSSSELTEIHEYRGDTLVVAYDDSLFTKGTDYFWRAKTFVPHDTFMASDWSGWCDVQKFRVE